MIQIYYRKLEGDCSYEQSLVIYEALPIERKEKIEKLKNKKLVGKRIQTGHFLQQVLSKETGIPIGELQFTYGTWGKPELDYKAMENKGFSVKERIHFNMSHSGDYVVIAVSDAPVGIDIEHKTRNYSQIAKRCFCKGEYEDMIELPMERQPKRFLEIWTMKEAYIKWNGKGMQILFHSFDVRNPEFNVYVLDIKDTGIPGEYVVSVCGENRKGVCFRKG